MTVEFFKALGDETRLFILMLIEQQEELCVCDLTFALQLSQPKISRHLALLRNSDIIHARRQGKWMYYRLSQSLKPWQVAAIQGASISSSKVLNEMTKRLSATENVSERVQCC